MSHLSKAVCLALLSVWNVTAAPPADICGPFPILSAPYEEDGALDVETLVREARHVVSCGVAGFIWAQSNDAVDLLTVEEKKTSFTALAKAFAGSPVYVTLGCQGRDTADMEALARHVEDLAVAYPTTKLLIACRPPLDARTQDDLERYYRRLAAIARRPVIIQTYAADNVPNPSSELLLRLARERPDVFGWIKEETGEADADTRMKVECAAPEVKTVFSAWGSWGWLRQHRTFGTRGVISERAAYAAELMEVWRALNAKDDARADAIWKKYVNMLLLKKILPGGEHRNFSLHVLNRLGVFKNMVSREYADEKKTPGKWKLSTRTFTESEIAEIERRWKELREAAAPYIPGVSAGRDASPRCRLDEPFPWKTITYPYDGIATNNTPEAFAQILKTARETTLADTKKPAAVLIYGWNEYTEGGYIAPTRLNGDGHLKAVEKVFGKNQANIP